MQTDKNCYLKIEKADTGEIIISYDEKVKNGNGSYDGFIHIEKTEVFATDKLQDVGPRVIQILSEKIDMPERKEEKAEPSSPVSQSY